MQGPSLGGSLRTVDNVSLAYFSDYRGISDSVRDLCTAGFKAGGIHISQSLQEQKSNTSAIGGGELTNVIGAHSKRWLLNQFLAHDRHRSGVDQMSGQNHTPSEGDNPTCAHLDVQSALAALGVPEVVITLLLQDIQKQGMFMMVDASDRVEEVDTILDRNAGYIRTQYLKGHAS